MVAGVLVLWMRGLKDSGSGSAVAREQRALGEISGEEYFALGSVYIRDITEHNTDSNQLWF